MATPSTRSSGSPRSAAPPQRTHPVQTLTDERALAALANPARSRILDVLSVDGPSTASALAQRTDQAVGSTSHHLKILSRAGLIEEAPELARDRRERWWRLVAPSTRWSRAEFADDAGAVTAAMAAESVALQRQFERTRDWLASGDAEKRWGSAAFATQAWITLSPEELAEFSEQILELMATWRHRVVPDDGVQRDSVFFFARGFPAAP